MQIARILISAAVVIAVAVAAGAAWALPGSSGEFRSGAPKVTTSAKGPLFALAPIRPGFQASRVVSVRNTGESSGRFELAATATGSSLLARSLRVTVTVPARGSVYDGPLSGLHAVDVGTLAPGESVSIRLRASLPSTSDDNRLQGLVADTSFTWSAHQL